MNTKIGFKNLSVVCAMMAFFSFGCESKKSGSDSCILGEKFALNSKILNQKREVWISLPDENLSMSGNSPVLYLLDAQAQFNPIVKKIRSSRNVNLNKLIVVGIPNIDRVHDLTPTKDVHPSESSYLPIRDSNFITSGGGDDFIFFISNELIPFVDSLYHPSSKRIFAGHSLGGLLVVHTLLNYSDLFSDYIALDPSIWWNHQNIISQAKRIMEYKEFKNISFFLANSSTAKNIEKSSYNDSLGDPYKNQLTFKSLFEDYEKSKLNFSWKFYKNDTHGSLSKKALFDGLLYVIN